MYELRIEKRGDDFALVGDDGTSEIDLVNWASKDGFPWQGFDNMTKAIAAMLRAAPYAVTQAILNDLT